LIIYLPWLVLIPILGFFLLKDADSFRRSALAMLPRGRLRWRGDEFFQDVNSTLAAYIRAQLTACVLIGVISSVGFALIGMPSPLVLGLIAGALEFVPLVGPLVVAILAALLALLHSGFGMAFVVLLFLGILRIVQDYVIYPRIIGTGIHLHPLAVILAILGGAELAGVAESFLGLPVIAFFHVTHRHMAVQQRNSPIRTVLGETAVALANAQRTRVCPPATSTTVFRLAAPVPHRFPLSVLLPPSLLASGERPCKLRQHDPRHGIPLPGIYLCVARIGSLGRRQHISLKRDGHYLFSYRQR